MARKYVEVKYIVRRGFKGAGHMYKPGDEFIPPEDGKWNEQIIKRYCTAVPVESEPEPRPRRSRKKEEETSVN